MTARTVVLVGVFHTWRRFGTHDVLVFDADRAWRTPDGELPVSPLRDELLASIPAGSTVVSDTFHDGEHSLEALAYWLHHARRDREIVPVLVATSSFGRLQELSAQLGQALATTMRQRGLQLGRDVAVVISADAVHYGPDFAQTPFGEGGVSAYQQAVARDRALLTGPLAGPVTTAKLGEAFSTWVDPADPGTYRVSWCGRFSIPFGLMLLSDLAGRLGLPAPQAVPVAYGTSVGGPELPLRETGLGTTAPANLYHFVGYPGWRWCCRSPPPRPRPPCPAGRRPRCPRATTPCGWSSAPVLDPATHERVRRAFQTLRRTTLPGVTNLHPAYATLLVSFDPRQTTAGLLPPASRRPCAALRTRHCRRVGGSTSLSATAARPGQTWPMSRPTAT